MTSVPTCWTMIEGAAAGGAAERELFARRYGPVVNAYLRSRWRSGPRVQDVDDALQDVFLECLKDGGALERAERRRAGGFRAFLFGVARNVAARIEASDARRPANVESESNAPSEPAGSDDDPALVFDRAWALSTVREAMYVLARRAAKGSGAMRRRMQILDLRFREGIALRTIAERFAESPARIHKDYAAAREEFESALRAVVRFDVGDDGPTVTEECRAILRLLEVQPS